MSIGTSLGLLRKVEAMRCPADEASMKIVKYMALASCSDLVPARIVKMLMLVKQPNYLYDVEDHELENLRRMERGFGC